MITIITMLYLLLHGACAYRVGMGTCIVTANCNQRCVEAFWYKCARYSGPSLIRIVWDQGLFGLVKFSD